VDTDAAQYRLLVINERQSLEVAFSRPISLGRDVTNSVPLLDKEASRNHAVVCFEKTDGEEAERLTVKDLQSLNGVYVNGQRVRESSLAPGDEVVIGGTILVVSPEDDSELESHLSAKGKRLLERIESPRAFRPFEVATFSGDELRALSEEALSHPEGGGVATAANAAALMRGIIDLCDAAAAQDFYSVALSSAREMAGGQRGVIMIMEPEGKSLAIRAIFSEQTGEDIVISHNVMRIVIKGGKALFSPDVPSDDRLTDFADKPAEFVPHTLAAVPFLRGGKAIGFIYLDSRDPALSYSRSSLVLLDFLARTSTRLAELKGFLPKIQ